MIKQRQSPGLLAEHSPGRIRLIVGLGRESEVLAFSQTNDVFLKDFGTEKPGEHSWPVLPTDEGC